MKRLLVFLVSASLALCIGCSSREEASPEEPAPPAGSAVPADALAGGLPPLKEVEPVVEDSWPERVGREDENLTAEGLMFDIELAEPAALTVSCETESGTLDMEIEGPDGKSIFDQRELQTGEYEASAPSAGTYTVTVHAEGHTGNFWITPTFS